MCSSGASGNIRAKEEHGSNREADRGEIGREVGELRGEESPRLTHLDFINRRGYDFAGLKTASLLRASNKSSGCDVVAFTVKMLSTIRESFQKRRRFYVFAVTLLAFGLFGQAVHAKNADYFPTAPHSTRYSTTIKIADLAHHVVVDRAVLAVFHGVLPLLVQPQIVHTSFDSESPSPRPAEKISFRPLRSPPVILS